MVIQRHVSAPHSVRTGGKRERGRGSQGIERLKQSDEKSFHDLVDLCKGFYKETPYSKMGLGLWDEDAAREAIRDIWDQGEPVWVYRESTGALSGALFGNTMPLWFNPSRTVWNELVYWVLPSVPTARRGFIAKQLFRAAQQWCKEEGQVDFMWVFSIMPGTSRLLSALGLVRTEEAFIGEGRVAPRAALNPQGSPRDEHEHGRVIK